MSDTHKTDPWWVGADWEPDHRLGCQYRMNRRWHPEAPRVECDLPDEPPRRKLTNPRTWRALRGASHCIWVPDGPNCYSRRGIKVYGRSRCVKDSANAQEGGIRAAWRTAQRELLRADREDLDDVMLPDPRHRHYAIWDIW